MKPIARPSLASRQSSTSSSSSSSSQPPPRRRNSFASATASSLAHGGPSTMAPKHQRRTTQRKKLPAATTTADKENANNALSLPSTPTRRTPKKNSSEAATTTVLSPTPYYKVLEEREGVTSPRLTRSATKKRMMDNLDVLDDTLSPDLDTTTAAAARTNNRDGIGATLTGLRFESPSAFCATRTSTTTTHPVEHKSSKAAKMERRNPLRDPSPGRRAKKPRVSSANTQVMAAPSPGVNPEDMRKIMTECLESNTSSKLLEAVREKSLMEAKYYELKIKYDDLLENGDGGGSGNREMIRKEMKREMEDRWEKQQSQWEAEKEELHAKVVELREKNVEYVEQLTDLEAKCKEKSDCSSKQWEMERKELQMELEQVQEELAAVTEAKREVETNYTGKCTELDDTKAELARTQEELEEKSSVLQEATVALEEAKQCALADDGTLTELRDQLNDLRQEYSTMKEELDTATADLTCEKERVQNLQSSMEQLETDKNSALDLASEAADRVTELERQLQTREQDLESAREELDIAHSKLEGVTSPRSRSAVEEAHHQEVSMLQNRISTLESRVNEKQVEMDGLIEERDASREELKQYKEDCEGLAAELEETQEKLTFANEKVRQSEAERADQLEATEAKLKAVVKEKADGEQLLEELASENEMMLQKCEKTKSELQTAQQQVVNLNEKVSQLEEDLGAEKHARDEVEQRLATAQKDIVGLESRVSTLCEEISASQELVKELTQDKNASDTRINVLSNELSTVTANLKNSKAEIASLQSQLQAKQHYCDNFEKTERQLLSENHMLNEIRRNLHNRVIQLSGNIRVFVRVRPMIESELLALQDGESTGTSSRPTSRNGHGSRPPSRESSASRRATTNKLVAKKAEVETDISPFHFPDIAAERSSKNGASSYSDLTKQTIEIIEPYKDRGGLKPRQKKWKYGFDRVYQPDQTQDDIWEGAEPLVQSCLDGFNVCMFAYGQTGSGKTHTMIGDNENKGLIPRSVQLFFDTKADIEAKCKAQNHDVRIDISVELLEVYNEEVRDLLSPNAGSNGKLLKVDLNSHEAVGNVLASTSSKEDVDNILQLAQSRRCVKATKSNAESSRSHLLFTIHFKVSSSSNEDLARNGCLHIIDLAGSEQVNKSGSYGTLLTEAKHINKSLFALTGVIEKLQAKADHIPYRDSKLTYLLRNSLGGDSKTLAIVCCSPQIEHFQESHNSIRFAAKASKVELKEGNKVDV